jgi:hypothetical protein
MQYSGERKDDAERDSHGEIKLTQKSEIKIIMCGVCCDALNIPYGTLCR